MDPVVEPPARPLMAYSRRGGGAFDIAAFFFKQQQRRRQHYVVAALLVLLLAPLAAGDVLGNVCGGMSNYTGGSRYEENLRLLAATLPGKAASSTALFATTTTGAVPDAVHGLAQCRGDTDASTCDACLTAALEDARQLCLYDKDATVYYDRCVLRFSNQDFLLDLDTSDGFGQVVANSSGDHDHDIVSSSPGATELFDAVADYAAANLFATGVLLAGRGQSPKLFALAQCTADMAPPECRACLAYVIGVGVQRLRGRKQSATVHVLRCNYAYGSSPFFSGSPMLRLLMPVAAPAPAPIPAVNVKQPPASTHGKTKMALAIALPVSAAVVAGVTILLLLQRRKRNRARQSHSLQGTFDPEDIKSINSLAIPLSTLRAATGDFCIGNLIGQGGFGKVYKGILQDNQEIAVKRLSQTSRQGLHELRNEIVSVAKLRHRNLVRVKGVCLEGIEKLIIYEYLPNGSLDKVIFDPQRRSQLGPDKVMTIIVGIARGLQYVHEDSQARIIHRDLKATNILLDHELNPKISDFGLARILGGNQSQDVTGRPAGTIGYMAPEYLNGGNYSVKTDVYSYGILVLETITGNRNGHHHLLNLVWEHWEKGTMMDIIVGSSSLSTSSGELLRRCLQIGLLCVQDNPADRPTMSAVTVMLLSSSTLPQPSRASPPAPEINNPGPGASTGSQNDVTITELQPR